MTSIILILFEANKIFIYLYALEETHKKSLKCLGKDENQNKPSKYFFFLIPYIFLGKNKENIFPSQWNTM